MDNKFLIRAAARERDRVQPNHRDRSIHVITTISVVKPNHRDRSIHVITTISMNQTIEMLESSHSQPNLINKGHL